MKYQYLLFDWDGTLHNTLPAWIKAIEKTLKVHNTHVPRNEVVGWLVPGITENINRYLAIDPEVFKSQVLATNEIRQLHEAALHDKIFDHLTTIATLNIPTALVTSSDRAIVEAALKHHKLHAYFNVVVSGNDINNRVLQNCRHRSTITRLHSQRFCRTA
ncbi:HAD hydrolase-like protein [Candidatus Microgenomates bacterium]|nr:HAD hydrolase-like protein [Candidatus Microgenomates bacterium]